MIRCRFASLRGGTTKQSIEQLCFMPGLLRFARNDVPVEKNKKNTFFLTVSKKAVLLQCDSLLIH